MPRDVRRIARDRAGRGAPQDVYCYFDNTDKLDAPRNALFLRKILNRLLQAQRVAK